MMLQSLLLGAVLAAFPPTQLSLPEPARIEDEAKKEKLTEWPSPSNAGELKKDIQRLRKARTEEMGIQAVAALKEAGAASAPLLIKALGKEKDEEARERILDVLTHVTAVEHTRLLARELKSKDLGVRVWTLRRLAVFPDHDLSEQVVKHLAALKKKGSKADPDELKAAALCTLSTGEIAGLDVVFGMAKDSWKRYSKEILIAAREIRGKTATSVLAHHLSNGDRKERVAALRLLSSCGDPVTALSLIRPFLDNTDNSLRIGAINALRGIVDGDPPLDKLPVFEAIERANKWKNRV